MSALHVYNPPARNSATEPAHAAICRNMAPSSPRGFTHTQVILPDPSRVDFDVLGVAVARRSFFAQPDPL